MPKLENGDRLPEVTAPTVEGGSMTLPDGIRGSWSVLAFYRGHW